MFETKVEPAHSGYRVECEDLAASSAKFAASKRTRYLNDPMKTGRLQVALIAIKHSAVAACERFIGDWRFASRMKRLTGAARRCPMFRSVLCAGALISFVGLGACTKEGSAEKAGEKMDSAIEEATTGKVDKEDGSLEKTGESIDQATGKKDNDPVDAIHDATDNDPKTRPN